MSSTSFHVILRRPSAMRLAVTVASLRCAYLWIVELAHELEPNQVDGSAW